MKVKVVETGWGNKECVVNIPEYCAMIANFKAGKKSSVHYHLQKLETYYVLEGTIELWWTEHIEDFKKMVELKKDDPNFDYFKYLKRETIKKGHKSVVLPNIIHHVVAVEDSKFLEVSTQHLDSDMFRVILGD
jgi:quercetin dioxygenase-like cupin family protein